MRQILRALVIGLAVAIGASHAQGQIKIGGPASANRIETYYSAPGYYGTTYGVAGYGLRQTYSTFASPFGVGYGYGLPPTNFVPGSYGANLWKPGVTTNRRVLRNPNYGTFAIPSAPRGVPLPPFGVYAPGFGPGLPPNLYGR